MSLLACAKLLQEITTEANALPVVDRLSIEGLSLAVHGEDSNLETWLADQFGFVESKAGDTTPTLDYSVTVTCSDRRLRQITGMIESDQFQHQVQRRQFEAFKRVNVTDDLTLDYFPGLGAAWITSRRKRQCSLIYSSRTHLPMKELRLGLLDVIVRYLEDDRWVTFFGSAVEVNGGGLLLLGENLDNRSMALCHLLAGGAHYLAGDRVMLKSDPDGVRIRGFAQTMGIGLAVATLMPELKQFVQRPDRLRTYQSEFNFERVFGTAEDEQSKLPDRLKLLPGEVTAVFNGPTPIADGVLKAIVEPHLVEQASPDMEPVPNEALLNILRTSYIAPDKDLFYPRWLPIELDVPPSEAADEVVSQLVSSDAWKLQYGFDPNRPNEGRPDEGFAKAIGHLMESSQ